MDSLEATEAASAAVAKAPDERVTLDSIKGKIGAEYYFTAEHAIGLAPAVPSLRLITICMIVMNNGFVVIGKSAPASEKNFNADLGKKFAYEDAVRQIWPLEGYLMRERLAA